MERVLTALLEATAFAAADTFSTKSATNQLVASSAAAAAHLFGATTQPLAFAYLSVQVRLRDMVAEEGPFNVYFVEHCTVLLLRYRAT